MAKKIRKRTSPKKSEAIEAEVVDAPGEGDELGGEFAGGPRQADFKDMVVSIPEPERDPFERASHKAAGWVEENRPLAIGLILLLVLAPLGVYAFYEYSMERARALSAEVSEPLRLSSYPAAPEIPPPLPARPGDPAPSAPPVPEVEFATREAKWEAVLAEAREARAAAAGDDLERAARLIEAGAALRAGEYAEAEALYEAARADVVGEPLEPLISLGYAMSLAAQQKDDEALSALDALGGSPDLDALVAYQKGRILERAGQAERAKEQYHKVVEASPINPYRADAERRLATL